MSLKATLWVWEHSETTGATRLVHLCLADRAEEKSLLGNTMVTFPASRAFIASRTRLSVRQITRAITELTEKGLIARAKGGYGTTSSRFLLQFDDNIGATGSPAGATESPAGATESPASGDIVSPLTSTGLNNRIQKEKEGKVHLSGTGWY